MFSLCNSSRHQKRIDVAVAFINFPFKLPASDGGDDSKPPHFPMGGGGVPGIPGMSLVKESSVNSLDDVSFNDSMDAYMPEVNETLEEYTNWIFPSTGASLVTEYVGSTSPLEGTIEFNLPSLDESPDYSYSSADGSADYTAWGLNDTQVQTTHTGLLGLTDDSWLNGTTGLEENATDGWGNINSTDSGITDFWLSSNDSYDVISTNVSSSFLNFTSSFFTSTFNTTSSYEVNETVAVNETFQPWDENGTLSTLKPLSNFSRRTTVGIKYI